MFRRDANVELKASTLGLLYFAVGSVHHRHGVIHERVDRGGRQQRSALRAGRLEFHFCDLGEHLY